jgi:hypothetical protein
MAAISTHLHHRPYQVSVTKDPNLPYRKWRHLHGTKWAVSHKQALVVAGIPGSIVRVLNRPELVFEFSTGDFVRVTL